MFRTFVVFIVVTVVAGFLLALFTAMIDSTIGPFEMLACIVFGVVVAAIDRGRTRAHRQTDSKRA